MKEKGGFKEECPMCNSSSTDPAGEKESYEFYVCNNCQFTFCPKITPQYLTDFYTSGAHGPNDGAPKKGWVKDHSFLDPAMVWYEGSEIKILDFGTGQSMIPAQLREKGHKVTAVDIAPPIEPHPDRLTGDILELNLPPDEYDFIFSFQVFEHLPRPKPVLDELVRVLRPGGKILIHTDMETEERMTGDFIDWWYVLPPDHCSYYRPKTFDVYARRNPVKISYSDEKRVILDKI